MDLGWWVGGGLLLRNTFTSKVKDDRGAEKV